MYSANASSKRMTRSAACASDPVASMRLASARARYSKGRIGKAADHFERAASAVHHDPRFRVLADEDAKPRRGCIPSLELLVRFRLQSADGDLGQMQAH